jgi:hypothetical protein
MVKHIFSAATVVIALATSTAAHAQVPSYAQAAASEDVQIHGRITSFNGGYDLTVRDERGFLDNVRLHPGTIINPVGLTLAPGMIVSVIGYNMGGYFDANEVDTPYMFTGRVPFYAGHPWQYYGTGVNLSVFFGNPGWWHGEHFQSGYHYTGGARVYDNVHVHNVYRGGTFHGHMYEAPREHGGYYPHERGEMERRGGHDKLHDGGHDMRHDGQRRSEHDGEHGDRR